MVLNQDYFDQSALSSSGVKDLLVSPLHFKSRREQARTAKPAMIVGQLVHYHLLQANLIDLSASLPPDSKEPVHVGEHIAIWRATKTFGKTAESWLADNSNRFCCTEDQWVQAKAIADSVLADKRVAAFLGIDGEREKAIYLEYDGVACKAMFDIITPDLIIDVKTTDPDGQCLKDASAFEYSFSKYKYDVQAAWYLKMAELWDGRKRDFIFLTVETKHPFGVIPYDVSDFDLQYGWEQCEQGIEIYKDCLKHDSWPGYPFKVKTIDTSRWRRRK